MKRDYKLVIVTLKPPFASTYERIVAAENFNDVVLSLRDDEYILELWEDNPLHDSTYIWKRVR